VVDGVIAAEAYNLNIRLLTLQIWLVRNYALVGNAGYFIGTASVVAMVSTGELATAQTLQQFKSLGN